MSIFRCLSQLSNPSRTKGTPLAERGEGAHIASDNAPKWVGLQTWLHSHVRDILDESDDILHSRFQLIYTIGVEQHLDGYPERWTITQQVLRLVQGHAHTLARNHPNSVEYECGPPGSFPHIRILRGSGIGPRLISMIVEDVMAGRVPHFDFQDIAPALHDAIRSFISEQDILRIPDTAKRVEEYAKCSDRHNLWSGLLLLRGLLTSHVLLFALTERRWRVDYGLVPQPERWERRYDRASTILAVPYRAKDVPALDTQFGHPDLTIILTCLSYYFAGLTEEQLRVSFEMLIDQDDPSAEYALWVKEHDRKIIPDSLRTLRNINLRSSEQWDNVIFPLFSRNQAAIDFYLVQVVFPKEAKEFPCKISSSSWDLAEEREKPLTGVSVCSSFFQSLD